MSNIHNTHVYENGVTLSDAERNMIRQRKQSVSRIMAVILRNRPGTGLNYGEMISKNYHITAEQNLAIKRLSKEFG